jgi:uncharacterized phage-associated protein
MINKKQKIECIKQAMGFIFEKSQEDKLPIGMIRLTKLLYLLDVEHFREKRETFTGLDWIYYKYGPYAPELESIIKQIGVEIEDEDIEEKTFRHIKPYYEEEWVKKIDLTTLHILDQIWKDVGLESLKKLLDYVYFETEPMENPIRGERLDFNKIIPRETPIKIKWDEVEKTKLKEIGSDLKNKLEKISLPQRILYPPETFEILDIWDEDISDLSDLKGQVNFDLSIFEQINEDE